MFKIVRMESYALGNDNGGVRKGKISGSWTLKTSKTESTEIDFINNFSEPPSLQHIAVVSIAIGLWTAPDVRNEMTSSFFAPPSSPSNYCRVISELERRILNKLSNSSLPSSLKTEISYVIPPIKLQLWKVFNSYYYGWIGRQRELCEYYMKRGTIYWTVEGTVDKVKSLKELFNNGSLDICHLYEIACSHCLEEYASILWVKIPEQDRNLFRMHRNDLITYWTCVLDNNLGSFLTGLVDYENIFDNKVSIDVNMITFSIQIGNIVALKYFWKKLSGQEKNDHFSKWLLQATQILRIQKHAFYQDTSHTLDVLCFLLSHVNRLTQMTEFFRNHSDVVLMFLFENWPYRRIFLSTIFELLDNLQEEIYASIMMNICSKMSEEGDEMIIFKEVWSASPLRLRRSFLENKCLCEEVLLRLLKLGNISMTDMILKDASKEEIKLFICFMFGRPEFTSATYSRNLNSLHVILSKSTLPPECYPYKINFIEQREQDRLIKSWLIGFSDWHICIEWICHGNIQAAESFLRWVYQSVGIEEFKKTISSPDVIYLTLIFLSNYELVDQIMNWYFQTGEEIQQFKANFLRKRDSYFFKRFIDMPFIVSKREGGVLQKFINYNLSSLENVSEFRLICRICIEYALSKGFLESATLLLNASFDNINEVKLYKNELILSEKGIKKNLILKQSLTDADWNHVKEIVMWSSPLSLNTVTELKSLILEQKTGHSFQDELNQEISALLDLLENVVEKDTT
ncbi:uncharacterized protein [Parasteatoda tepidariorum]|uniref:uncharacterized protein isoform X1 n=1 Tax=Parasteatoda tepidariorum TaxID=114398 RepID=UPI001C722DE6|nr:uncharacterized protein LOC107446125 isoform X2 [Parasteatoda tepidariorum]